MKTKTATELKISEFQKANLAKQAFNLNKHAKKVSKHFSMASFADREADEYRAELATPAEVVNLLTDLEKTSKCNTTCCAVGWGPAFGIPSKVREPWVNYANRVFTGTISRKRADRAYSDRLFSFLFDAYWPDSPKEAAKRIAWFLEKGLPDAEYWSEYDAEWSLPKGFKSYTPDWKSLPAVAAAARRKANTAK